MPIARPVRASFQYLRGFADAVLEWTDQQVAAEADARAAAVNALIAGLPGPYANDAAAASGGVAVGGGWIDTNGFVRRRLS